MSYIKAIIVDDEPHAREIISLLLKQRPEVEVVAECDNGLDAVETIKRHKPAVVFLDIQMPELNGFKVIESLQPGPLPIVIFITAFDEYAIRAFEISAIDYILKPYDDDRFFSALDKAEEQLKMQTRPDVQELRQIFNIYNDLQNEMLTTLSIRSGKKILFIPDHAVEWIEAADQYCKIHTADGSHLVRESMKFYEQKLNPKLFYRTHRSSIVNLKFIKELQLYKKGRYAIILKSGQLVELGQGKLDILKAKMAQLSG